MDGSTGKGKNREEETADTLLNRTALGSNYWAKKGAGMGGRKLSRKFGRRKSWSRGRTSVYRERDNTTFLTKTSELRARRK